ncbi:MAG: MlaD family protein [Lutibacter sp.]|jgi:phospholipid/cholesterol/gamma-HCH transport system substrate-binding protein|nr:MlaD family protein [Lutibacter sp.]
MKITKELKTGVIAVLIIGLSIWGYNYLKGINFFDGPQKIFYAVYDNVQDLSTASVVTINGVEVGKVQAINFNKDPKKRGQLIVAFSVETDFEFSKKSLVKIYSASLMGGKSLAIVPSYEGPMAVSGDYLVGEIESDIFSSVTEKLNPLQAKVENVIVSVDSLLFGLNDVFDKESRRDIKSSITKLNSALTNLEHITKSVEELVQENEAKLSETLSNTVALTDNLHKLSETLNDANIGLTVKTLETTLNSLNTLLADASAGKGSMGKLLKDDAAYDNLVNASKSLESLLTEVKLHPKRFVHFSLFGKKDKGYQDEKKEDN